MAYTVKTTISFIDFTQETSQVQVSAIPLTAANFDAQIAAAEGFETALAAIQQGNVTRWVIGQTNDTGLGAPANKSAQRERKWLARYHALTPLRRFTLEIPCADLSLLTEANRKQADLTAGAGLAFKTAWDGYVRSPDDNSATILDSLEHVGRNI